MNQSFGGEKMVLSWMLASSTHRGQRRLFCLEAMGAGEGSFYWSKKAVYEETMTDT